MAWNQNVCSCCSAHYSSGWIKCRSCGSDIIKKPIVGLRIPFICVYCGKKSKKKSSNQVYCSIKCREWAYEENQHQRGRFLIFERDAFTCAYCGKTSYGDCAKLNVDHIKPKVNGHPDIAWNLITACEECNLSKSKKEMAVDTTDKILKQVEKRNKLHKINPMLVIKLSIHK